MTQAIFYKEWIKTRWILLLATVVFTAFVWYTQLRIGKAFSLKGAAHLWDILLTREHTFYEGIRYIPLLLGMLLGLFQFAPEMQQKRLKLTLHLPVAQNRMVTQMLLFGTAMLTVLFALQNLFMFLFLKRLLAPELTTRILLTALPWFAAGIAAYGITAWTVLEPTWRRRVANALIGASMLRLFFLAGYPEAYNGVVPVLVPLAFVVAGFSYLSVERFKQGVQHH